jgi:hypothetical protein
MAVPAWVSEIGIAGTWVIAISAIWGERVRAALFKPHLDVSLVSAAGESITETLTWVSDGKPASRQRKARYYHLRVSNRRRFPVAHETQLAIEAIEMPGPDGTPHVVYRGPVPLTWRHQSLYPTARNVGPAAEAHLFAIDEDDDLKLMPLVVPNNFVQKQRGPMRMWVTVAAHALECDSQPVRVAIAWDGKWEAGEAEMLKHVRFTASEEKPSRRKKAS